MILIEDDVHSVHLGNMTLDSNVNYGIDLSLSDKNTYLSEVTGANKIKFGNIKALETAVQFKKAATDFALDENTAIESNLGALQHEKLNVNGNGHTVDGAGVTFYLTPRVESSVGYEGKFRKDYSDHTGYVSAKYKF